MISSQRLSQTEGSHQLISYWNNKIKPRFGRAAFVAIIQAGTMHALQYFDVAALGSS